MCQDEVQHGSRVLISASPNAADFLLKAVKHVVTGGEYPEETNDFKIQNPASRKLFEEVEQAFEIMAANLTKEVERILDPTDSKAKGSEESKVK